MRKQVYIAVLLLIAGSIVFFNSCRKVGASWDTDITAPLFKTSISLNNLIADSFLTRNADSSMMLVYKNPFYNYSIGSLFSIPDTSVNNFFRVPVTFTFNAGDQITPGPPANTTQTTYSLNGVGLKRSIIKSGRMLVSVRNRVREKIKLNYQIPCARLNNIPFSVTVFVPAATSATNPGIYSAVYDLSNYDFNLSGVNNNSINTVVTVINANIDPAAASSVVVNPSDSLIIKSTFQQLVPSYGKGYFGQTVVNVGPSETGFNVFSKITSGSILLQSVTLNFNIQNSVGVDARINISDIYSKNSKTGTIVHLTGPIIGNPININRATEIFGTPPVIPTNYSTTLNNSNSNAKALIENLPDKFGYQFSIAPNPLGNVSGYNDFVYYGYGLKASLDMQIPLSLVANNLTLSDTIPVNFDNVSSNLDQLHRCTLSLYSDNGFPFDANVQIRLVDKNNVVNDSIMGAVNQIDEAPVDANYKAIGTRQTILVIPVSSSRVSNLVHSKKMIIIARFNTSAKPNYIKIYSTYKINFKLTGDFSYTIQAH